MHRHFKAIILVAVAAICLFSFTASAEEADAQAIRFAAYCESINDIDSAVVAGADFISVSDNVNLTEAVAALRGRTALIIDADSIEEAEEKYARVAHLSSTMQIYFRIKLGASDATEWAKIKSVNLIGHYKGNIWPLALAAVSSYGKYDKCSMVQMQTDNQDGVILHNSVTSHFDKNGVAGVFSFVDSTRSAKRTDSARSWDDLISRGYTVIKTAYPNDFAEYLSANTVERGRLQASIDAALAISTEGCSPNRVSDYNSALEAAQLLIKDGSSATYAMADARTVLDETVANITIPDGSQIQGDLKFTPGRIAWAVFGVALILSWQLFFRSRWAKKKES
ncbi:MAG: hypothetical protein IIW48_09845 [Clostridia bacterium]|nr:hypothetical protein [Clostridia bacterium]